jgi:uncharacterized protein
MTARSALVAAAVLLAVAAPSAALAAPAFPAADGRCIDEVGVLGGRCGAITAILRADEETTSDEIAVAVVPTTGDAPIETWSTGLFNDWGVGKAGAGNGVLLVVAVEDHKVRLETGRGLSARLDDAIAGQIISGAITPKFAADDYAGGILDGLDEVRRTLGHDVPEGSALAALIESGSGPNLRAEDEPSELLGEDGDFQLPSDDIAAESESGGAPVWPFVLGAFGILGLFGWAANRSGGSSRRYRGGSSNDHHHYAAGTAAGFTAHSSSHDSSSSSGSSFGGGSSDGGGSSGSW